MIYGSLFSGIGGFDAGLDMAGHACAFQVELDPFCRRILAERWPDVPRHGDIRAIALSRETGEQQLERVDLLVGGFPCQDLSVAGKRAGLIGERSGLFWAIVRIATALRPTWGLFENVPGLLSSHGGRDMATVLEGLRQCWPVVGYRVLDSQHFGVAQRRRRVFLVGGPTEAGVAEVLALTEGGGGDSASGGEAGAGIAATLVGGVASARSHGKPSGSDRRELVIARSVAAGSRYDGDTETFVTGPLGGGNDGIGRRSEDDPHLVVDTTQITSAKNYSNPKPGDPCHPLAEGAHPPLVMPIQYVEQWGRDKRQNGVGIGEEGAPSFTLDASYPHGVAGGSLVRRLTPVECERLQGFPDGWTCLCQPLSAYVADPDAAALVCTCPDSPRYRALGNAVTVNVVYWLGRRLAAQDRKALA